MEPSLEQFLEFSNYRKNLEIQKKILKDKLMSGLTIGYEGGLFVIDHSLIVFVQFLVDRGRTENIPILDINQNPILISDLKKFQDHIVETYFYTSNEYLLECNKLKSKRNIKDFLKDYE